MENNKLTDQEIIDAFVLYINDFVDHNDQRSRNDKVAIAIDAWNIACLPTYKQDSAIQNLVKKFKRLCPANTRENLKYFELDVKLLIKNKTRLFPDLNVRFVDFQYDSCNKLRLAIAPPNNC